MPVYRADQHAIHLSVAGVTVDNIVWDKFDGGDLTVDAAQYLPGGMAPQINLGGTPKRSDITLNRAWSYPLVSAFKALDGVTGRAAATVTVQTLSSSGSPTGVPVTYTGVLNGVTRPSTDSTGSNTIANLQVVIGANRAIS